MQECSVQVRGQAQRGAEGWLDVLRQHCADLEVGLAQEHQHRVRQEREKVSSFNWDAVLSLHVCLAYLYTLDILCDGIPQVLFFSSVGINPI